MPKLGKLIVLRGLPGAGKSTLALKLYQSELGIARVNRDLLREMLSFGDWTPEREKIIISFEREIVQNLLLGGWTTIVDDTNLNPKIYKAWEQIAKNLDVPFETIEVDTGLEECLRRNANRTGKVSPSVIIGMAMRYKLKS